MNFEIPICADSDLLHLEIRESTIPGAGNGVFVQKKFERGDILCEYRGEIIKITGATRELDTTRDIRTDGDNVIIRANDCVAGYVNDCSIQGVH